MLKSKKMPYLKEIEHYFSIRSWVGERICFWKKETACFMQNSLSV